MSPVLDSLTGPLGASSANIGLMISAFTAPAIVMIPVAGALADRYTRKLVLIAALLLFGLAGAAIGFTTDFGVVLALRVVQGFGFAGLNPIIVTSIGDMYTQEKEATGQGIRMMVSGLSGAVFPLLAGVLVLVAWQYPFGLYGIAIPVAIGVFVWFDEPTTEPEPAADGGDEPSYVRALFGLLRRPRVLSLVLARSLMNVIWIAFMTYNSFIVVRLIGGTPVQAGMLATVGYVVFALSASQTGRITEFFQSRFYPLVAANLLLVVGFISVLFAPTILLAAVGIAIGGFGFGILGSLYRSVVTGLAPVDRRAGLVSLSEAGGRVTATATPIAMGAIIALASQTMGFGAALRLGGVVVALGGGGLSILCLFVARASPPAPAERRTGLGS
jgi:MFS family permease